MDNVSKSVVDPLVIRECMVATLVADTPKAKAKEASDERVECPYGETRHGIEIGVRKGDVIGCQKLVKDVGKLAERDNDCVVHEPTG